MPRKARSVREGEVYHLVSKFVAAEWFIKGEEERRTYLHLLGKGMAKTDWRCFSFAVMNNHIHLESLAGTDPMATWMREVHGPFAEWINRRYGRVGPVFMRPKVLNVDPESIGYVMAYIHRNPVAANVVQDVEDSTWTSHRAYAGLAPAPAWLDVDLGVELARAGSAHELAEFVARTPVSRAELKKHAGRAPGRRGRPPGEGGGAWPSVMDRAVRGFAEEARRATGRPAEEAVAEEARRAARRPAGDAVAGVASGPAAPERAGPLAA